MRFRWVLAVATWGLALAGCATSAAAPAAPPSARDILAKPERANLTDAHFVLTTKLPLGTGATVDATGDGVIVYKPAPASRIQFQASVAGQTQTFEILSVGGTDYTSIPGSPKWTTTATTSNPATLTDATEASYVGEENLSGGKAWHVKGKDKDGNPFDVWIRESDGYPLKFTSTPTSSGQALTITFDKYNTGETVSAPPASQVQ